MKKLLIQRSIKNEYIRNSPNTKLAKSGVWERVREEMQNVPHQHWREEDKSWWWTMDLTLCTVLGTVLVHPGRCLSYIFMLSWNHVLLLIKQYFSQMTLLFVSSLCSSHFIPSSLSLP